MQKSRLKIWRNVLLTVQGGVHQLTDPEIAQLVKKKHIKGQVI